MINNDEPQYIIFVYEDGREERLNWQDFSRWQEKMRQESIQEFLAVLDAHAASQLAQIQRDLSDERPTEH